jgi:hypothetical protein
MSFVRKAMILAVVPLLVLGQEADSDEGDGDAAPKADAAEGFAPYQTILDRLPFGPLPPNFNPDAPPGTPPGAGNDADGNGANAGEELTEDEQQIVASVRVSILNVTPSGVAAVGFTDSSLQPPVHYYMKVGEKRDVWEVKEADPAEQTVVLLKNGVEATLKVGEGVAGGDNKKKAATARPMSPRMLARAGGREGNMPSPHMSAMERLRARRRQSDEDLKAEEARREAVVEEARKDAAKAAAEREQQREALLQIQEELRRQREERELRAAQEAQEKPQEDPARVE